MDNNFQENNVVVITGATKGLGKALSLAFANASYEVIGIYRSDSDSAKSLELEFKKMGLKGSFVQQDITEDGNWEEFTKKIKTQENKHITLIANACIPFSVKPLHLINWEEILEQLEVNVKGTFLIFKHLLPFMVKSRNGLVISVLSTALTPPSKGFAAYVTAKSALDGLTKSISAEYISRGIRVFSVSPGFMETSFSENWSEHLKALIYNSKNSLKQPIQIADSILKLAQDKNIIGHGENYQLD